MCGLSTGHAFSENQFPADDLNSNEFSTQIVGGVDAEDGPYRWTISLQGRNSGHFCGGSLVSPTWVVTAAHCVDDSVNNPTGLKIVAGRNHLGTTQGETVIVKRVIVHPNYNTSSNDSDIALLELSSSVSSDITPISLADSTAMNTDGQPGDMTRVLGWGATRESGPSSSQLLRVDVPIVSNSSCSGSYSGITENMICAGLEQGGKDSCQGDSGGPLVISKNSQYHLAGVVSFGRGCARAGYPGVYTRVEKYTSWIAGYLSDVPVTNELVTGIPVTGLNAAQGETLTYTLDVPAGVTNLSFRISGGAGDADLYVKFGSAPTDNVYDCRPYIDGNEELCEITNVEAGTYFVNVKGYRSFSGVNLVGQYSGTGPTDVINEVNLSGTQYEWLQYQLEVPEGTSLLKVNTFNGTGDADLYVRSGSAPTTNLYDCRPYKVGNVEECMWNNPEPGTWFIYIRAYSNFTGVSLTATLD
jgi:secreted trypsin-like serine protease